MRRSAGRQGTSLRWKILDIDAWVQLNAHANRRLEPEKGSALRPERRDGSHRLAKAVAPSSRDQRWAEVAP